MRTTFPKSVRSYDFKNIAKGLPRGDSDDISPEEELRILEQFKQAADLAQVVKVKEPGPVPTSETKFSQLSKKETQRMFDFQAKEIENPTEKS